MGDIVGGIIGGIGSIFGGNAASKKEDEAAKTAMTGYNYLAKNPLANAVQANGQSAITNQDAALEGGEAAAANQGRTVGSINDLLTGADQNSPAFKNYLNSTGYNFQLQQGTNAIAGNSAAKGLLNSGATAKALTSYGQNLGSNYFNQYLGQLGGLAGEQGANLTGNLQLAGGYGNLVNQGLTAATATGQAGTTGGNNAGNFQAQAGQSQGTSMANAFNMFGGTAQNALPALSNFFI